MKNNIGLFDKILRISIITVAVIFILLGDLNGILTSFLAILSLFLLYTVIAGICPIYRFIGISTKKHHKERVSLGD